MTPYFANTTQTPIYNNDGTLYGYFIAPVEGYVLHDNVRDWYDEIENVIYKGYTRGSISVYNTYNFEVNSREIYTVLENDVRGVSI